MAHEKRRRTLSGNGGAKHRDNVTKFRRQRLPNLNFGMIIFLLMFIYVVVMVVLSFKTKRLTGYEVQTGSLATRTSYRGIAIRSETIYPAGEAGYLNFYAREDARVSKGELIYSIDKSGTFSELIARNEEEKELLSDEDLKELKTEVENYSDYYSDTDFSTVYDFKYSVGGTATKLINSNAMKSISSLSDNALLNDSVSLGYSSNSGIVIYSYDGMEDLTPDTVSGDSFDNEKYKKHQIIANALVSETDPAYKLVDSENWSIVIPVSEENLSEYEDMSSVRVKFLKNGYISTAATSVLNNGGSYFLVLNFKDSMITFATDRFIDVQLITEDVSGLKIPNSAIVDMEFYLVPEEFLTSGSSGDGFMRRTYLENGELSVEFVQASVYQNLDGNLYINTDVFNPGDVLIAPDSEETYTVNRRASLTGVYNINKGYADFTKIDAVESNEEYTIVSDNAAYGLRVFDRIALDAERVNEDDLVVSN